VWRGLRLRNPLCFIAATPPPRICSFALLQFSRCRCPRPAPPTPVRSSHSYRGVGGNTGLGCTISENGKAKRKCEKNEGYANTRDEIFYSSFRWRLNCADFGSAVKSPLHLIYFAFLFASERTTQQQYLCSLTVHPMFDAVNVCWVWVIVHEFTVKSIYITQQIYTLIPPLPNIVIVKIFISSNVKVNVICHWLGFCSPQIIH